MAKSCKAVGGNFEECAHEDWRMHPVKTNVFSALTVKTGIKRVRQESNKEREKQGVITGGIPLGGVG